MTDESRIERLLDFLSQEHDDELGKVLHDMQLILLKHPVATQRAFRALTAEGRRFAETAEGQAWKERLTGSELVRRARSIWEVATFNALEESPRMIPTQYIDALCAAVGLADLEPALARAMEPRGSDGASSP